MAFIKDLQPYTYGFTAKPGVLAWGWLEKFEPVPVGDTNEFFLLSLVVAPRVHRMRGSHQCQWCTGPDSRGNGEIWFKGKSGAVYAAPSLVTHYIQAHGYGVPQQVAEDFTGAFIDSDEEVQSYADRGAECIRPPCWEDTLPQVCPLCHGKKVLHMPSEKFPGVVRTMGCTYCHGTGVEP